ncbi:hypothetical protein Zmor_027006 [Zophobas morio]|uniref:Transposable element P transposase-like RNase H domain-containing protein n=1 Tax=Zophobas morio TaxID=2755281 RepID=A0AA38HVU6_9CUCU|nr:hypothetical protein Zmor_027006 [Zophobas morio]
MKLPFPAIRTLNFHLQNLEFKSGVLDEIIGFLKIKCESLNQDFGRDCMVALDEMDIKAGIDYCVHSGTYIGGITLPKHEGVATKALVILVGGITTRWKQIVSYYFTGDSMNGAVLADVLKEVFKKISAIGLKVHSVTSDMGSANQAMWKTFGIKAGRKCETKNYVLNPVNGEKIYFLADGPHLLKNIKQCLVQNKIIQLPNDFVEKYKLTSDLVDVQHIKDFCEEEGKFELQFASKLNVDLLQSNHFNKMNYGLEQV